MLLNLGLVESVDDGIFPLSHKDPLDLVKKSENEIPRCLGGGETAYLLVVVEGDLTDCHAAILLEVRPWCVNDGDVILLVT